MESRASIETAFDSSRPLVWVPWAVQDLLAQAGGNPSMYPPENIESLMWIIDWYFFQVCFFGFRFSISNVKKLMASLVECCRQPIFYTCVATKFSFLFCAGNVLFNFWRVHCWKSLWQELGNCPANLARNSLKVAKPKMGIWFPKKHLADRECCYRNWWNAEKVFKQCSERSWFQLMIGFGTIICL